MLFFVTRFRNSRIPNLIINLFISFLNLFISFFNLFISLIELNDIH